jgi:hypothetical protein
MRTFISAAILFALTSPSAAEYFDTGNDLYRLCQEREGSWQSMACAAAVSGGFDMMIALGYICTSPGEKERAQVRDVVVRYLRDHPENRGVPAAFSIILAMEDAFGFRPSR